MDYNREYTKAGTADCGFGFRPQAARNICQPKCITSERIGNVVQKAVNVRAHEYKQFKSGKWRKIKWLS